MFLSSEEIINLTGRTRPTAQIRWLRANGFETLQRADGLPLVLRSAIENRMSYTLRRQQKESQPNWSTLNATPTHTSRK